MIKKIVLALAIASLPQLGLISSKKIGELVPIKTK